MDLIEDQCICKEGFYLNEEGNCEPCGSTCKTCSDSEECTSCQDDFVLGETICLKCDTNQFISGDDCINCHESCESCENSESCLSCPEGSTQGETICLECFEDEYIDGD